ncbi:MAG: chemotaxis protein CheA [Epulopiscium sp. Nele67-Bin004]|nr:MAG: chemotaxis protein CheA [Epulopiscium sp. Nele67-Bin004]
MDMTQYLQIFIEESKENLQSLNETLLQLETDPENMNVLNDIFRVAHTLKGMAGTMGFTRMQHLTHSVENVLSEIRNGKLTIVPEMVDILFQCLDALENYVENIVNTSSEGEESYPELIQQLEAILNGEKVSGFDGSLAADEPATEQAQGGADKGLSMDLPESVEFVRKQAIESGMNVYKINVVLSNSCMLKAARAFIVFAELGAVGEIIYSEPTSQEIEDEKFEQEFTVVYTTDEDQDKVKEIVMSVAEVDGVELEDLNEIMVEISEAPELANEAPAATVTPTPVAEPTPVAAAPTPAAAPAAGAAPGAPAAGGEAPKQQVAGKSVRVNIDRLDTLMNLVSELIIVKTQLEGLSNSNAHNNMESNYNDSLEYLERVSTSLHDAVMKVRMVPVETVFNRFPRMIRDVSRKLGKNIELVMSGEETELDRTVIDEIGDPLIHLLRNAADHGLETTKERIALEKNEKGTIKLQAYQDGNSVVIEVEDDGKGIDPQKIKQKALEKGMPPEELAGMSDQEIIELLFKPSFSTAEKITDLSGRGVGLDVVKSKITTLGGNVEISTVLGKGSRFIVRLPLTLAIIQALMVNIIDEKYAIPLSNIQNIENINSSEIKLVQNQEVIVLRNEVIPVIRLDKVLELPPGNQEELIVVVVKKGEKQVGFVVDSLIGQQEIVIKPLGKYFNNIHMIAGATILGNGEVALILDINTLV